MARKKRRKSSDLWGYRLDIDPQDTVRVVKKNEPLVAVLPGNRYTEITIDEATEGVVINDLVTRTEVQFREYMLALLMQDSEYVRAMDLLYVRTDAGEFIPRFSLNLVRRYASNKELPTGVSMNNLEEAVASGTLKLQDLPLDTFVDKAYEEVNRDEERVKKRRTVERWFTGDTLLALPKTMQVFTGTKDSLGRQAKVIQANKTRRAFYDLRNLSRALNEAVTEPLCFTQETKKGSKTRQGSGKGSLQHAREKVRKAREILRADETFLQVPGRIVSVWKLHTMPSNVQRYTRSRIRVEGSVASLQEVNQDRLVVSTALGEALHAYVDATTPTSSFLPKQYATMKPAISVFHIGLATHLQAKYGRLVDPQVRKTMEHILRIMDSSQESITSFVHNFYAKNLETIYEALKSGEVDAILSERNAGVEVPPGTVFSALQTDLRLSRHLPRLFWRQLNAWNDAAMATGKEREKYVKMHASLQQELKKKHGIDVEHTTSLVDTRMTDAHDFAYLFHHNAVWSSQEYYERQLRKILVTDGCINTFTQDQCRTILSQYGLESLMPFISPGNFLTLPQEQYDRFSTVRGEYKDGTVELRFENPALFMNGLPLIWIGLGPDTVSSYPARDVQPVAYPTTTRVVREFTMMPRKEFEAVFSYTP